MGLVRPLRRSVQQRRGLMSARLLAVMRGVGVGPLVADASAGGQPSSMSPSTECVSPSTSISNVIFALRFSSL